MVEVPVKPPGPGLLFVGSFKITGLISFLVIFLFIFFVSSQFRLGDCIFLRICLFLLGCPFYQHTNKTTFKAALKHWKSGLVYSYSHFIILFFFFARVRAREALHFVCIYVGDDLLFQFENSNVILMSMSPGGTSSEMFAIETLERRGTRLGCLWWRGVTHGMVAWPSSSPEPTIFHGRSRN